jgi:hypothetical protein
MVFDSPEMNALRIKFGGELNHRVPDIVFLDRYDGYKKERAAIEKLVSSVSISKQNDWLGRLISPDHQQHVGAWFEIMLFEWLKQNFEVKVEPDINGKHPDFLIEANANPVLIESIAFLYSPDELLERLISSEFTYLLETIEKPYAIDIHAIKYGSSLNRKDFLSQVMIWLDNTREQPFHYEDMFGNIMDLTIAYETKLKSVGVLIGGDVQEIDTDLVKKPLLRKIKQRQELKEINIPYVIALYPESWHYDADQVIDAWFGKPQTVIDIHSGKILREQNDLSGVTFHRRRIHHRGISGILVFKRTAYPYDGNQILNSWYIQNPYALHPINPDIFKVLGRFVVVSSDPPHYKMDWIGTRP